MTDNEKRAHDIAIATINIAVPAKLDGIKVGFNGLRFDSHEIDIYSIYKEAYDQSLAQLNSDSSEKG
jgi:exonuclease I